MTCHAQRPIPSEPAFTMPEMDKLFSSSHLLLPRRYLYQYVSTIAICKLCLSFHRAVDLIRI